MVYTTLLILTGVAFGFGWVKAGALGIFTIIVARWLFAETKAPVPKYCARCRRMLGKDNPAALRFVGLPFIWGRVCADRLRCNRRGTQHVAEVRMKTQSTFGVKPPDEHYVGEGRPVKNLSAGGATTTYLLVVGKVTYALCPLCHHTGNTSSWVQDHGVLAHRDCVGAFQDRKERIEDLEKKLEWEVVE